MRGRRLWITFLRRFWGVFSGGFLEPTGPGASVWGVFSADGVLLVRWASANFDFFRGFFTFLDRFLPVFVPFFALFPSMSCAYLYVNNYFSVSLAWFLLQGEGQRAGHFRLPICDFRFGRPQKGPTRGGGNPSIPAPTPKGRRGERAGTQGRLRGSGQAAGWGAGERTRKPEPGNRKKGAKGRGPEIACPRHFL